MIDFVDVALIGFIGLAIGIIFTVLISSKGILITVRHVQDYKEVVKVEPEDAVTVGSAEYEEAQYQARKAKEKK